MCEGVLQEVPLNPEIASQFVQVSRERVRGISEWCGSIYDVDILKSITARVIRAGFATGVVRRYRKLEESV